MGHNNCCFLTPGVTFRLYPRLYLQIAQVHLDCAVALSQAAVPTVPALVTHRSTRGVGGSSTTTGSQSSLVQSLHQDRQEMCLLSLPVAGNHQESPGNASLKGLETATKGK